MAGKLTRSHEPPSSGPGSGLPVAGGAQGDGSPSVPRPSGAEVIEELIESARDGSRGSFSQLIRIHRPTVQRVALRLVGNHEDSEDVAQEAFVRAWSSLAHFKRGENATLRFGAWLLRITVHLVSDLQRRRGRRPEEAAAALIVGFDPLEPAAAAHAGPSQLGVQRETERRVDAAIAALPEKLRVAFVLRSLEGLEYEAIAEITGAKPATVRSQMVQARRALRRLLSDLLEGDES